MVNASPLFEVSYFSPSSVALRVPSHDPIACLWTTATLALRETSLTRMVMVFAPGPSSIVFCTLSNPAAVNCTRLLPGCSFSSDSGVLPTNWRSMNTDAPGTSDSSVSEANVGAAAVAAAASAAALAGGAVLRGASAGGVLGAGTGSSFLGMMRGGAGAVATTSAAGAGFRAMNTTPTPAMTATAPPINAK